MDGVARVAVQTGLVGEGRDGGIDAVPPPHVVVGNGAQGVDGLEQMSRPGHDRCRLSQGGGGPLEHAEQFGERAGHGDTGTLDIGEGDHRVEDEAGTGVGHDRAEEQLIETSGPGVHRRIGRKSVGGVVVGIETPVDVGGDRPGLECGEGAGIESELQLHRGPRSEVEHLTEPEPSVEQVEDGTHGVGERAVGAQRAIGDAHGDGRHTVLGIAGERGLDERREAADIGAQHGDVARIDGFGPIGGDGRIVEEVQERIAQDLDLTSGAMGAVPLETAVVLGDGGAGVDEGGAGVGEGGAGVGEVGGDRVGGEAGEVGD